jgi:ABC-2 type transport system permease protein
MRALGICLRIMGMNAQSQMAYRRSLFMMYVQQVFGRTIELASLWIVLSRFREVRGWTFYEIIFLYLLNLLSYGLASLFVGPIARLDDMIRQGTFDGLLVRPLSPLLHLIARGLRLIFLGHLVLSGILFALCSAHLDIRWNVLTGFWLFLVVIGAALIQWSIMMIAGTTSFWFVRSRALVLTTIYSVRGFVEYPITIYDRWLQVLLTFVIPYAFVNFYPAQHFLGKAGQTVFHPAFQYGTPVVGAAMFLLACGFWRFGVNHYQSTGS